MEPKHLKAGDPCPSCGAKMEHRAGLSAAEFKVATDRENPRAMPPFADTASPAQRAELGDLFACARCPYQARIVLTPATRDLVGADLAQ